MNPSDLTLEERIAAELNNALAAEARGDRAQAQAHHARMAELHAMRTPETVAAMEEAKGLR